MAMPRNIRILWYTALASVLVLILFFGHAHRPLDRFRFNGSAHKLEESVPGAPEQEASSPSSPYAYQYGFPNVTTEKLAYVTWLSSTIYGEKSEEEDVFFIATRILVWQLLHYEKTKTKGIDVVVIVTPDVSESRRKRLRKDGATVRPIDFVHGKSDSWLHPGESRWNDIMSKLRAWEMTEYSRILMLDGDIILLHRLDGIFNDPSTAPLLTNRDIETPQDEPDLPSSYLLASIGEVSGADHPFPPTWDNGLKKPGYFCAGLFMLQPNKQIFKYYTALLDIPNRFDPKYMEQALLNYAHRWDGPMPWKELDYTWNIRSVNDNDLDKGLVSMHEKWWEEPFSHSERVKGIFQQMRWQMEGYYLARDELRV